MRRFNYTGRRKILQADVTVRLKGTFEQRPVIDLSVNLEDYGFPPDAEIFLEAQKQTRFERHKLKIHGTLVRINSLELAEFDDSEGLQFKIKIISPGEGRLLGIAENIKPLDKDEQPDRNQYSILPVRSTDLSDAGVLWRVDYSDQSAVLEIEKELGGKEQVARSLLFMGFVLPAAMREILVKIVSADWDEDLSDPQELSTRWLRFTQQIGVEPPDNNSDNHDDWLDDAVGALGKRMDVRQQIINDFESGAWK